MQTNLGKRLKSVRTNLESTSLEQGALTRDQVRAQATALAQKKKRMGSAKPIIHETRGGRSEAVKEKERQKQDEEVDDDDANDNEGDGDDDSEGEDDDNSEGEDDGEDEDEDNSEGKGEAEDEENSKGKAEGEGEDGEEDGDGSLDGENDKGGVCTGKPTQRLNVVLAPRPDQGMMSRDAKKKIENARQRLGKLADLRAALVSITSLWKQAKSNSDKMGCESQIVALGQSIYNCGVYSETKRTRDDSSELLDKLAGMLRSSEKETAKSTNDAIELLCSDLKGKMSYYICLHVHLFFFRILV